MVIIPNSHMYNLMSDDKYKMCRAGDGILEKNPGEILGGSSPSLLDPRGSAGLKERPWVLELL